MSVTSEYNYITNEELIENIGAFWSAYTISTRSSKKAQDYLNSILEDEIRKITVGYKKAYVEKCIWRTVHTQSRRRKEFCSKTDDDKFQEHYCSNDLTKSSS